jgi:hypothetical protein
MCLTEARYGIAWGAVGAAMACFDEGLRYAKDREVFGTPLRSITGSRRARSKSATPKKPNPSLSVVRTGHAIAKAKYLEFELTGSSASAWPVAWTRTSCYIFLPPCGRRLVHHDNVVTGVESWSPSRSDASAVLLRVWDSVLHVGLEPDSQERAAAALVATPLRLSPSVFNFTTALVDEGDDAKARDTTPTTVGLDLTADTSGVFIRTSPSSSPPQVGCWHQA